MEEKKLYREKSLTHFSSPEQMTDYLKVTGVGVWAVLCAIVVLLLGGLAWAAMGTLETTIRGSATVEQGQVLFVTTREVSAESVKPGQLLRVGKADGRVLDVSYSAEEGLRVRGRADAPDGRYDAEIVMEQIHPISFLLG